MTAVLDHGHVKLLDMMGDDMTPVRAARVSYDDELKGIEQDSKLLKYLLTNRHTSPFEQVVLTWEMKMPIFVARQIVRHRTASLNEVSQRYTELDHPEFYIPEEFRKQDKINRQSSKTAMIQDGDYMREQMSIGYANAYNLYSAMLHANVAREQARIVLPLATYTKWIWTNDLHNTLHFLSLRMDDHAQWETRQYANAMFEIMKEKLPIIMGIWSDLNEQK